MPEASEHSRVLQDAINDLTMLKKLVDDGRVTTMNAMVAAIKVGGDLNTRIVAAENRILSQPVLQLR